MPASPIKGSYDRPRVHLRNPQPDTGIPITPRCDRAGLEGHTLSGIPNSTVRGPIISAEALSSRW
jgi:hypothetical protein